MICSDLMMKLQILKLSMVWSLMKKIEIKYSLRINYLSIRRVFKKLNLILKGLKIVLIKSAFKFPTLQEII